jgi:hypothetical protein
MKKLDVLNHTRAMEEITLEQEKIKALTLQREEVIKAQKEQSVKVIKAEAVKAQAYNRSQKSAEALMAESIAYSEAKKI